MIKLSKLTDYAVVILASMAKEPSIAISASVIAEDTALPEPTVAKVLKLLAKGSLVNSMRGAKGGYVLLQRPHNIQISDVIAAIEGPIALTACVDDSEDSCAMQMYCELSGRWNIVNQAIKTSLNNITLADMLPGQTFQMADVSGKGAQL